MFSRLYDYRRYVFLCFAMLKEPPVTPSMIVKFFIYFSREKSETMALNLLARPLRALARPAIRNEFRYLYTSYYMSHLKHKANADHPINHNNLSAEFVNDPVPISPFSSSTPASHFATSVQDSSRWLSIKKKVGHVTGRWKSIISFGLMGK